MKINIMYDVVTSFALTVVRDKLPETHDELLESVTRDELAEAPMDVHDIEWGNIKEAWRSSTPDNTSVSDAEDASIEYYTPI